DANGVESIAGIMGGEHSGCDAATTDVLIESALWEPLNIARTGRALGINTDARYRFERGVDLAFAVPGAELATALVIELGGGPPAELRLAGAIPGKRAPTDFPLAEVRRLTGLDTADADVLRILASLGFEVSGSGPRVAVTPPTWRPDIEGKADLTEE